MGKKRNIWNDYFGSIRKKYSMRVSPSKPLVIDLDGKNVTASKEFSLIDPSEGGFVDMMEQTAKHFSEEYNCLAIFGVDEISFIFNSAESIIRTINSSQNYKNDEIISIFSQYFFDYFNGLNSKRKIFWHGKTYSISEDKIKSYIKYKSQSIMNVFTTYFLKRNMVKDAGNIELDKKLEMCNKYDTYKNIEEYASGILYLKGKRIDIEQYLEGNIVYIENEEKKPNIKYIDLKAFDDLI